MKRRLVALLGLLTIVALLAPAASTGAAQPPLPPEVALAAQDNGRQVSLDGSHLLAISLDSNPSTGYSWQVAALDRNVMREAGDSEFKSNGTMVGGNVTQILRFKGVAKGQTNLTLEYRRPWETAESAKTYSIKVESKGAFTRSYTPAVARGTEAVVEGKPGPGPTLPAHYSWCEQGKCTPVRDQGQCGSCWAFSTVGALESAILIKDGVSRDLSEQYLVSCNSNGWGCNGGWYAHDYHQWKYIAGEPGPGAVNESDFRYQAADVACNPPHTHYEKISSWKYVGGSNSVPTVSAIKQAIYTYGPVSVAVYVGSAFQAYRSGIFSTTQKGSVNHAVVLVGWDDTGGYWIMRNSWGGSWGESGYMRIKYGTSNIGYGASYVVYP